MKTTNGILGAVLVLCLAFAGLSTASDTYATNNKSNENSRYNSDKRNESSHKDKDDDHKDKKDRDEKKRDHKKDDKRAENHDRDDDKKSDDRDDKHDERSKDDDKRDHKDDDRKDHNKPDRSERDDKSDKDKKSHKFTICHATNSTKNPYVMITVDYHSFVKKGHDGHEGAVPTSTSDLKTMKENKQRWGDVIPAVPEHNYAGSNWTASGKALLDNKCKLASLKDTDDGGNGSVTTPDDETPVVHVLDEAASTDVPALAGKGGAATELPQTGSDVSSLIILAAGMLTAAATYGVMFLRKSLF